MLIYGGESNFYHPAPLTTLPNKYPMQSFTFMKEQITRLTNGSVNNLCKI